MILKENKLSISINNDQTITCQAFSNVANTAKTFDSLPLSSWNLVTVTFILGTYGPTHFAYVFFGTQRVGVFEFANPEIPFQPTDLVRIGGPSGFIGQLANLRFYSPGSNKITGKYVLIS